MLHSKQFCDWLLIFLLIQLINKVETKKEKVSCSNCIHIFKKHCIYSNVKEIAD